MNDRLRADLAAFASLLEAEWYNGNLDEKAYGRLNRDLQGIVVKHNARALATSDPAPSPPDKPAYMVGSAWPGGPAPAPVAPEGLVSIAARVVRLDGGCEKGHRAGQWHMHEEPYHSLGRELVALYHASRRAAPVAPEGTCDRLHGTEVECPHCDYHFPGWRVAQDSPDPLREALATIEAMSGDAADLTDLIGEAAAMRTVLRHLLNPTGRIHDSGCGTCDAGRALLDSDHELPSYRAAIEGVSRDH